MSLQEVRMEAAVDSILCYPEIQYSQTNKTHHMVLDAVWLIEEQVLLNKDILRSKTCNLVGAGPGPARHQAGIYQVTDYDR